MEYFTRVQQELKILWDLSFFRSGFTSKWSENQILGPSLLCYDQSWKSSSENIFSLSIPLAVHKLEGTIYHQESLLGDLPLTEVQVLEHS